MDGGRSCQRKDQEQEEVVKNSKKKNGSSGASQAKKCVAGAFINQLLLAIFVLSFVDSTGAAYDWASPPHSYWQPKADPSAPAPPVDSTPAPPVVVSAPPPAAPAPHTDHEHEHLHHPPVDGEHDHEHHDHDHGEALHLNSSIAPPPSSRKNSTSTSSSYLESIAAKRHGGGKKEGIIAGVVFSCIFAFLFFIGSAYIYMTRKYNLERVNSTRSQIDGFIPPTGSGATPYSSFE